MDPTRVKRRRTAYEYETRARRRSPPARTPRTLYLIVVIDRDGDVIYKSPFVTEDIGALFTPDLRKIFKEWYCNECDVSVRNRARASVLSL